MFECDVLATECMQPVMHGIAASLEPNMMLINTQQRTSITGGPVYNTQHHRTAAVAIVVVVVVVVAVIVIIIAVAVTGHTLVLLCVMVQQTFWPTRIVAHTISSDGAHKSARTTC